MNFLSKLKNIASFIPVLVLKRYKYTTEEVISLPTKYVKRPVIIEACVFDGTLNSIVSFIPYNTYEYNEYDRVNDTHFPPSLTIKTLEGDMIASVGDYIICGVSGEYYPCKPDIFKLTYKRHFDK